MCRKSRGRRLSGFRVTWTHPNERDHMIGGLWPDEETVEMMADSVREAGMLNVSTTPSWGYEYGELAASSNLPGPPFRPGISQTTTTGSR